MTKEEQAEEYVNTHPCYKRQDFIRTYLDGQAEGKPKWHDLRKNPTDLPKESGEYWCKLKSGHYDFRIYYVDSLFYKSHWEELEIIAWCELPKFEE